MTLVNPIYVLQPNADVQKRLRLAVFLHSRCGGQRGPKALHNTSLSRYPLLHYDSEVRDRKRNAQGM